MAKRQENMIQTTGTMSQSSVPPFARHSKQIAQVVEEHLKRFVGPVDLVFHEKVSDELHIDIHVVNPTEERNYYTLMTSGMSEYSQHIPADMPGPLYSELMLCLPAEWLVDKKSFRDEANYWPIRWLKIMARYPAENKSWLYPAHVIPNGDPPQHYSPKADFCGMLILRPVLYDEEFSSIVVSEKKTIEVFSLIPLYEAELEYYQIEGLDALLDRFEEIELTEYLDVERAIACQES